MKKSVLLVAMFALVVLVSCQTATTAVGDAKTQFCDSLATLQTAVDDANALGPMSTVDDAKAAGDNLEAAWADVQSSSETLAEVQLDATKAAYDEMLSSIRGITDDTTLAAAVTGIQTSAETFRTAAAEINTTVCTGMGEGE